jgi:hypothetical protein
MSWLCIHRIGANMGPNGQYDVPCSSVPSLPPINFTFSAAGGEMGGGRVYSLSGSDYVVKMGSNTCISAFSPMSTPSGLWILGKY